MELAGPSPAGHDVMFATPSGQPARADDLMVTGRGLDPWGARSGPASPHRDRPCAVAGRRQRPARRRCPAGPGRGVRVPDAWGGARRSPVRRVLVFPGGHRARGMRPTWRVPRCNRWPSTPSGPGKPVGAICHGVLVAARAVDPVTGQSVLQAGRRTTALTWAPERRAWGIARWSRFWDSVHHRTYMEEPGQRWGFMSVQEEGDEGVGRCRVYFADVEKGTRDWRRKTKRPCPARAPGRRPAGLGRARWLLCVGGLAWEMRTRSPGPSPRCWLSRPPDRQLPSRTRSKAHRAASPHRSRGPPPRPSGPPTSPDSAPPPGAGDGRGARVAGDVEAHLLGQQRGGQLPPGAVGTIE